jgi:hypothetical protein
MAYNGEDVALLGRDDRYFDSVWLSADHCDSTPMTDGHTWPSLVASGSAGSGPTPPGGLLVLDKSGLEHKLMLAKLTTSLRSKDGVVFDGGGLKATQVWETWHVIYGRIETRERLRWRHTLSSRDFGNGFGNGSEAPVQIVHLIENEFIVRDAQSDK